MIAGRASARPSDTGNGCGSALEAVLFDVTLAVMPIDTRVLGWLVLIPGFISSSLREPTSQGFSGWLYTGWIFESEPQCDKESNTCALVRTASGTRIAANAVTAEKTRSRYDGRRCSTVGDYRNSVVEVFVPSTTTCVRKNVRTRRCIMTMVTVPQ